MTSKNFAIPEKWDKSECKPSRRVENFWVQTCSLHARKLLQLAAREPARSRYTPPPPQILTLFKSAQSHLNVLLEGAKAVFGDTGVVAKGVDRGLGDGEGVLPLQPAQGDPQQV